MTVHTNTHSDTSSNTDANSCKTAHTNAVLDQEPTLAVLHEIRDELREFNKDMDHLNTLTEDQVKSTVEFVAKVNSAQVPADFYENTELWHVTIGDSDQDR